MGVQKHKHPVGGGKKTGVQQDAFNLCEREGANMKISLACLSHQEASSHRQYDLFGSPSVNGG